MDLLAEGSATGGLDFVQLLTNFGVAVACLVALGLGVWRALTWLGRFVAKPVADRHIKFLDELSTAMASQSQALQTMSVQQGRNLEGLGSIMEDLKEVLHLQKQVLEKQDELFRIVADRKPR